MTHLQGNPLRSSPLVCTKKVVNEHRNAQAIISLSRPPGQIMIEDNRQGVENRLRLYEDSVGKAKGK